RGQRPETGRGQLVNRRIGLVILVLVIAAVVGYQLLNRRSGPVGSGGSAGNSGGGGATAKGYVGGEKIGLLNDDAVKKILRDKYGVGLDYTRLGSIEMVRGSSTGQDFLWPSSQIALDLYKERGGKYSKAEILFNSPMVLYSRRVVTDALIRAGIVRKSQDAYYIDDFPKLI